MTAGTAFVLGVIAGGTGLFVFATGALLLRDLREERARSERFAAIIRHRYRRPERVVTNEQWERYAADYLNSEER